MLISTLALRGSSFRPVRREAQASGFDPKDGSTVYYDLQDDKGRIHMQLLSGEQRSALLNTQGCRPGIRLGVFMKTYALPTYLFARDDGIIEQDDVTSGAWSTRPTGKVDSKTIRKMTQDIDKTVRPRSIRDLMDGP
jgi:hypothetical protein